MAASRVITLPLAALVAAAVRWCRGRPLARGQHVCGLLLAGTDPSILGGPVGDPGERGREVGVELRLLARNLGGERVVQCLRDTPPPCSSSCRRVEPRGRRPASSPTRRGFP